MFQLRIGNSRYFKYYYEQKKSILHISNNDFSNCIDQSTLQSEDFQFNNYFFCMKIDVIKDNDLIRKMLNETDETDETYIKYKSLYDNSKLVDYIMMDAHELYVISYIMRLDDTITNESYKPRWNELCNNIKNTDVYKALNDTDKKLINDLYTVSN